MSNFAMGTILGKGFAQAKVHTNHSTSACAKPFPKIVPMAKLDIVIQIPIPCSLMPICSLFIK